jgi:type IV pilus assembly protein PilM
MMPFLDAIINEIKRVNSKYEQNFNSKIQKIILSGGGAKLLGIDNYFSSQFNLPVSTINPFLKVNYPQSIEPLIRDLGPSFSVAIGLGIKEFI